tara:strand:+ start:180 stop:1160 length:981 start_codon:yes stop_codon:yes gene_type:complete
MPYKIYKRGSYFYIIDTENGREREGFTSDVKVSRGTITQNDFYFKNVNNWAYDKAVNISEILDYNGNPYLLGDFITFYENTPALDVTLQDSSSSLVIVPFTKLITESTLSVATSIDDLSITVVSAVGVLVGQLATIYSVDNNRYYFSQILAISGNVISLDSNLDFAFSVGDFVSFGKTELNVDGSVTPQIYGVRNPSNQDIPLTVDINRIVFAILTSSTVDLSKFGNILGGITRGLLARKVDSVNRNIFNVKTNAEFKNIMFDIDIEIAKGNAQDGITGRFSFSGQDKLGAVIRLKSNEDLQIIVQDDLTSLESFKMMAEGSEVVD